MDIRQVAFGAVFGAAVAVNAALQSLQDAGSFLVESSTSSSRKPSMSSSSSGIAAAPGFRPSVPGTRAEEQASDFPHIGRQMECTIYTDLLNDDGDEEEVGEYGEDADRGSNSEEHLSFFSNGAPVIDNSGSYATALAASDTDSLNAARTTSGADCLSYYGRKLPVKRKSADASLADYDEGEDYLKVSDEENSSTEDGDGLWEDPTALLNMSKKRKTQRPPPFLPLLPQMIQSEEAMSAMLQQTTETVFTTLADARVRRERMLLEMRPDPYERHETSLDLVTRFIDALINVGDSLKVVHSALFPKKDDPQFSEFRP